MSDRAGTLLRRVASPAALFMLLLGLLILVGVGGASALARRSPAEEPPVTISMAPTATAATAEPSAAPETHEISAAAAPSAAAAQQPPTATTTSIPPVSSPPASGGGSLPPSPATPAQTAVPAPSAPATASPTSSAVPAQPIIQAPESTGVGEAFVVHVVAPGATSVAVELDGATYTAAPNGDRFWLVLGVAAGATSGPRTIRAIARNASGGVLGASVAPLQYTPVTRPVDYLELTEEQGSVLSEEAGRLELSLRAAQFSQFDSQKRWGGRFIRPLLGFQTTAFGQGRSINGGPVGGFHSGMDIAADLGDPVRASAAGRVAWVGEMPIRGRSVIIDHGVGVKSGYHHLDQMLVSEGALVEAGEVVGAAGSTGLSTGPHLHWEVTVWGVNVDPLQWTAESFEP